jgi:hypothetical protein
MNEYIRKQNDIFKSNNVFLEYMNLMEVDKNKLKYYFKE